ncbi:hypothetical protein CB1_000074012 [Camelus ferus]|nr:hypothetical protein CB1_000074012 [Camelus ferus]
MVRFGVKPAGWLLCRHLPGPHWVGVYKNLQLFVENKEPGDELFDRLTDPMDGLTAKVFWTYNASVTLQGQLRALTRAEDSVAAKILSYNRANRAIAVLCNHQRATPKTFENFLEKRGQLLERLEERLLRLSTQATDKESSSFLVNSLSPRGAPGPLSSILIPTRVRNPQCQGRPLWQSQPSLSTASTFLQSRPPWDQPRALSTLLSSCCSTAGGLATRQCPCQERWKRWQRRMTQRAQHRQRHEAPLESGGDDGGTESTCSRCLPPCLPLLTPRGPGVDEDWRKAGQGPAL